MLILHNVSENNTTVNSIQSTINKFVCYLCMLRGGGGSEQGDKSASIKTIVNRRLGEARLERYLP